MASDWIERRLRSLAEEGLLREPADASAREVLVARAGAELLDASSNDYLGLAARGVSRETLAGLEGARGGAGASRLVQGSFAAHDLLEAALADWTGSESALLTSSAFAANAGALPALTDERALIVSDALNHASIVDGCRLSRARVVIAPHLELDAFEAALRDRSASSVAWVVTEALFSMDGDTPDLAELAVLCARYDAGLIVDEAHSLGVFGPAGAGLARARGVQPDLLVGGLGKAVGIQGGFLASSGAARTLLWNRARSFVFSTAVSPVLALLTLQQVRATQAAEGARQRLFELAAELRRQLAPRGLVAPSSAVGPIVPIVLGDSARALHVMARLRDAGILAQAIRPPTVPEGTARLRLTVHADWPDSAPERIAAALERACAS